MDEYWITYNRPMTTKEHQHGLINIYINKSPGETYLAIKPRQTITSFFAMMYDMPNADIEIKE
jgi:hypothetical protein